ncbi:acyltransferase family protein [Mesorhizobium xinjiangense]|uniref:acyltransferase family protein n=1 Tax=Mesorhizobium xinjiangense TaxID=2678685 RepID=UPI0012EDB847|nr:acyltransferase family protein [Mesorhizobium xinjiangense]
MKYRPDIDGLRAVAILPVLLFHSGVAGFSGGFVGVDVFFVISGYVIALSLLDDLENDRFSIWRFYAKRIRRIFPALFVTVAVTFVVAWLLLLPSFFIDFSKSLVAASLFVSNIYFWKASGYFAADAIFRPLLHTWSLSVEEQYYLFMPVAAFIIYKYLARRWLLTLLPAILASLALSVYATSTAPTANFFLLPTRAWELLVGAALALGTIPIVRTRWLAESLGVLGLGLIAYAVFAFDETTAFPGANALYPCIGSALLIHVGKSPARSAATSLLSMRPLVAVGLISYSLYLVHWPIVSFLRYQSLQAPTPLQAAAVVVASFVLAWLSWRFVERPFRKPSPAITQPRLLAGGVAAIAVFAVVGTFGVAGDGFPGRIRNFAQVEIAGHEHWNQGTCFLSSNPDVKRWKAEDCTLTHGDGPPVLLWGDSFAAQYVPGIVANRERLAGRVVQYTAAGCPPVLSYYSHARPRCTDFNQNAIGIIKAMDIETVILSARWTDLQSRGLDELESTLAALEGAGVKVYLIGQSPQFATNVQVIAHAKGSRDPDAVDSWSVSFEPEINKELRQLAGQGAVFIDPLQKLCDGHKCPYRDAGQYLYEDAEHFSVDGSRKAVEAYFPLLRQKEPPAPAHTIADI